MIAAYINYPNPHISIHAAQNCASIHQQNKPNQRVVRLSAQTLSGELAKFESMSYRFGADQGTNDMWLYVDFEDNDFERAVVERIRKLLAKHYLPFGRVKVSDHC